MSCHAKSILLIVLCCLPTLSWAVNYNESSYNKAIKYNSSYHEQIDSIIISSMSQNEWSVKSQKQGKITAWLESYKNYLLVVDISYSNSKIEFNHVDFKNLDCPKCDISTNDMRYYELWRRNLRSWINKALHSHSMLTLLKDPTIHGRWLNKIRTGSQTEKLRIGRYIFELSLLEPEALKTLAEEVESNYLNELSSSDIQIYAFYCKSLALTKDEKFKSLLIKVRDNAEESKLRKYVSGYLKTYFDNG